MDTAWVEGHEEEGRGEWIQLTFDRVHDLKEVWIYSGYQKSESRYENNHRPSRVRLDFSNGEEMEFELSDSYGVPNILKFDETAETSSVSVKISILDTYAGDELMDTCITEVAMFGSN